MIKIYTISALTFISLLLLSCFSENDKKEIVVGAERMDLYLPLLQNKKVALVVNQTSLVKNKHLVDTLLDEGIKIIKIFAPEHGFRGSVDAGETVKNSTDVSTGIPIISLYGKNKKPNAKMLENVDIIIFDIQDVGARFYTYISTMHYMMEACAENLKPIIILDRPNPNGHYVDGPVLDLNHKSFVGMHPIPIVHGLTIGELANMIIGEEWLNNNSFDLNLKVIKCVNYDHNTAYSLPIKPSPNLPNDLSIKLYPSLCLFEGTNVSVGRGTDLQFQIIGSPEYPDKSFSFTPVSKPGAKYPKHQNVVCFGKDMTRKNQKINKLFIKELIEFYNLSENKNDFFNTSFFTRLSGSLELQNQIKNGLNESDIRESWQPSLKEYKKIRKKYILYNDY